ncbi:unnamed protein product, partial [Urochloa humidicola]
PPAGAGGRPPLPAASHATAFVAHLACLPSLLPMLANL